MRYVAIGSGVTTIFGPPPTTCLGPWPRGYGDYFALAGPGGPLQPRGAPAGPPRSRGLRGPRYATGYRARFVGGWGLTPLVPSNPKFSLTPTVFFFKNTLLIPLVLPQIESVTYIGFHKGANFRWPLELTQKGQPSFPIFPMVQNILPTETWPMQCGNAPPKYATESSTV